MLTMKKTLLTLSLAGLLTGIALADNATDNTITQTIQQKYNVTPDLSGAEIKIETDDNVVYLSGEVETKKQYEKAIVIAESNASVSDVKADDLKIKGNNSSLDDTYITSKVNGVLLKNALLNKKDVRFSGITVTTNNGVVTLSGIVDNSTQRQNVINIVQQVSGVKSVQSNLTIQ